jgi:hypothetical protein
MDGRNFGGVGSRLLVWSASTCTCQRLMSSAATFAAVSTTAGLPDPAVYKQAAAGRTWNAQDSTEGKESRKQSHLLKQCAAVDGAVQVQVPPLQLWWANIVAPTAIDSVGVRIVERHLVSNAIML